MIRTIWSLSVVFTLLIVATRGQETGVKPLPEDLLRILPTPPPAHAQSWQNDGGVIEECIYFEEEEYKIYNRCEHPGSEGGNTESEGQNEWEGEDGADGEGGGGEEDEKVGEDQEGGEEDGFGM